MVDVAVPPGLARDEMTLATDRPRNDRDRGRTPMQWDSSPSAGFTTAARPWLPVGDAAARNVADQRADPGSTLNLCRDLLALRRAELSGGIAPYRELAVSGGLWAYRVGGLTVAANLSGRAVRWDGAAGQIVLSTGGDAALAGAGGLTLGPWQGAVLRA